MSETHISLKPTEQALVTAAATVYSGYLTAGRVSEGDENKWLKQSIKDVVRIAKAIDSAIVADGELH